MTEPKKRGRPAKAPAVEVVQPVKAEGTLTVKKADAIFDGEGGFYPVGHKFHAADETAALLIARGLAE